jgi:UTP--glucose-1-phosphate uridylyltransferase
MVEVFNHSQSSVIAVEKIAKSESKKYGVVDLGGSQQRIANIKAIVEKPHPDKAPSNLGVVGRYILTPRIFGLLEQTTEGSGGEIQLTDAIAKLLDEQPVQALQFLGKRYDCGSKLGYLEATIAYALKHPELAVEFKECLQGFI